MKNAAHIFAKEFKGYFISPIAYIVISLFLILSGWFFFSTFFLFNQAELRSFFSLQVPDVGWHISPGTCSPLR